MPNTRRRPSTVLPRAGDPEPPKPTLSIILVHGTVASTACLDATKRLAAALQYMHIHLPDYLQSLTGSPPRHELLGSLHPKSFTHAMENKQTIDPFFMLPILEKMMDMAVDQYGFRKFVISGMDEYETAVWRGFAELIAKPNAIISFVDAAVNFQRAMVQRMFEKDLMRIAYSDHETGKVVYERVLGAIADRALAPATDEDDYEDSGFTDEEL